MEGGDTSSADVRCVDDVSPFDDVTPFAGPQCNVHKSYTSARVFINEIKFGFGPDSDSMNAIEIAGPAGTSLNDYRLHFYHSNTDQADARAAGEADPDKAGPGTYYGNFVLSGMIRNMDGGYVNESANESAREHCWGTPTPRPSGGSLLSYLC